MNVEEIRYREHEVDVIVHIDEHLDKRHRTHIEDLVEQAKAPVFISLSDKQTMVPRHFDLQAKTPTTNAVNTSKPRDRTRKLLYQ